MCKWKRHQAKLREGKSNAWHDRVNHSKKVCRMICMVLPIPTVKPNKRHTQPSHWPRKPSDGGGSKLSSNSRSLDSSLFTFTNIMPGKTNMIELQQMPPVRPKITDMS